MRLFHLVADAEWQAATGTDAYRPASLASEGFIHLSEQRQLLRTAEKYFAGRDDLLIICIDRDRLTGQVKFEPVEADKFPHLYGPLNFDAVDAVVALTRGVDGRFALPEELRG